MHIQLVNALHMRTVVMLVPVFESMYDTGDVNGRGGESFMSVTQTQLYLFLSFKLCVFAIGETAA